VSKVALEEEASIKTIVNKIKDAKGFSYNTSFNDIGLFILKN